MSRALTTHDRKLTVQNLATGVIFEDDADVVVSCRGTLNEPVWPKVPGIQDFKGEMMHSALWNDRSAAFYLFTGNGSGINVKQL